jgi:antirestriction protein ArdC
LAVLREDSRAIFASLASKAADYLLAFAAASKKWRARHEMPRHRLFGSFAASHRQCSRSNPH